MSKSNAGRPTVMTKETVAKLEYGFSKGLSDVQACLFAGINRTTLHRYCEENPEFRNRKEELKNNPSMKAKLVITEAIDNGDRDIAKWYLERKEKAEFSTKLEQEVKVEVTKLEELL